MQLRSIHVRCDQFSTARVEGEQVAGSSRRVRGRRVSCTIIGNGVSGLYGGVWLRWMVLYEVADLGRCLVEHVLEVGRLVELVLDEMVLLMLWIEFIAGSERGE